MGSAPVPRDSDPAVTAGPWAPFEHATFRGLWIAALASYIAFWMQTVAGAWLMVSMQASPLLVALMQTAASLPMFLFSLPAGVLADLVNRRRLILGSQAAVIIAMTLLAVTTFTGTIGPLGLLGLTFVLGTGLAISGPAWQSSMAESVPRPLMPQALTLVGIAYNVARAVGPALAGALQAVSGPATVFVANAVAYVAAFLVVRRWSYPEPASHLPPERLLGGMRTGLQYALHAQGVRAPLARAASFMVPASAIWALLPVLGQSRLGVSAAGYGLLIGSLGTGAIMAGLAMPWFRAHVSIERTVVVTTILYALVAMLAGIVPSLWLLCPLLMLGGIAWSLALTLLNAALLTSVPSWVRSRTIALNLLVTQGAMAAGGALWGLAATELDASRALIVSGLAMLLPFAWSRRFPVRLGDDRDVTLTPVELRADLSEAAPPEAGPVAVEIRYQVAAADQPEFLAAAEAVGVIRRRNGARFWRLYRDLADDRRFLERFIVVSWIDYQRQLTRSTLADRASEDRLRALHTDNRAIETAHYLAER
jgi:MFS family permease